MGVLAFTESVGITTLDSENEAAFFKEYNAEKQNWNAIINTSDLNEFEDLETLAPVTSVGNDPTEVPSNWILYPPYRFLCKLIVRYPNYSYGASGVLISPQHVLTAGHCILPQREQSDPISIEVYPALNNNTAHVGWQNSTEFFVSRKWRESRGTYFAREYDFGVIQLPNTELYERLKGHFQLYEIDKSMRPSVFSGGYKDTPPFNSERPIGKQLMSQGAIINVHPKSISFTNNLVFGLSGSPLFFVENDEYYVIAVCAYGYRGNYGPKVRQEMYDEIRDWITS